MTKFEAAADTRKALREWISVQESITSDREALRSFQTSYEKLIRTFYKEHQDIITIQQYEAARNDSEYFLQLIESACDYYQAQDRGGVLH